MRIGIDVGGSTIEGVLLGEGRNPVAELVVPTPQGAAVADAVISMVRGLVGRTDARPVQSVGIGIPGIVDPDSGRVREALNLGVRQLALGELVAQATGLPIRVDNDVKATAVGAASLLGPGVTSLGYLNLGTGVAAAAVERGVVLRGAHNSAGEIGHLVVRDDGPVCACGSNGCVEAFVGGRALTARLEALHPSTGLGDLFIASAPSPDLLEVRADAARALAAAIRAIGLLWGSERIVIGGGVIRHARGLTAAATDVLRDEARRSPFLAGLRLAERLVVVPAGRPIAAIGAAALAADTVSPGGIR